jgi:hypothetical protein
MNNKNQVIQLITNQDKTYPGDLRHYFKHLWHAQNVDRPYHNLAHMLHVTWHAHRALISYPEINPIEIRIALIGAMFHDDNHPGKLGNDAGNIIAAIKQLQENILPEDKPYENQIISCIRATQFPAIEGDFPLIARIIRDVDIAYTLNDVWMQRALFGLGHEFGKTPEEMLQMQIPFLKSIQFGTTWAKQEYSQKIEDRILEVKAIMECLGI